jgi:O-antigen/teichoic acid export membrane protein
VTQGDGGARGYLLGALLANAVFVGAYFVIMARRVSFVVRRDVVAAALVYSLPLIPHAAASWILDLSDRALLTRFVSLADVGRYTLGYQLGGAISIVVAAFNMEWTPFVFRKLSQPDTDLARLARLATYYWYVLVFVGLGIALFAGVAVYYFIAPSYRSAVSIIPLATVSGVLNGAYIIPVTFLFWQKATTRIPMITLVSALVNVGMNLLLIPRVGMIGAAWATAVAYVVMVVLCWRMAQGVTPFPYEYGFAIRTIIAGVALFFAGNWFAYTGAGVFGRLLCLLLFPVALLVAQACANEDVQRARDYASSWASRWLFPRFNQ